MITLDEMRTAVITALKEIQQLDDVEIGDAEDFGDWGLDSLDGMSLVVEVEKLTGVDFGEFEAEESNSIEALLALAIKRAGEN